MDDKLLDILSRLFPNLPHAHVSIRFENLLTNCGVAAGHIDRWLTSWQNIAKSKYL
jgi:hypothetical protein